MRASGFLWTTLTAAALAVAGPGISEAAESVEQVVATQKAMAAQLETERMVREQEAEARRLAEEQRRETARMKAIERDRSCIIKPVMTDAEKEHCNWAWSVPPPQ